MMNPWYCMTYGFFIVREVVKGSIQVARAAWSPRGEASPAIVEYRMRCATDVEVVSMASSITITPGTLVVGVAHGTDLENASLFVHALFADSREQVIEDLTDMEDRLLRATRGRKAAQALPRPSQGADVHGPGAQETAGAEAAGAASSAEVVAVKEAAGAASAGETVGAKEDTGDAVMPTAESRHESEKSQEQLSRSEAFEGSRATQAAVDRAPAPEQSPPDSASSTQVPASRPPVAEPVTDRTDGGTIRRRGRRAGRPDPERETNRLRRIALEGEEAVYRGRHAGAAGPSTTGQVPVVPSTTGQASAVTSTTDQTPTQQSPHHTRTRSRRRSSADIDEHGTGGE
ncbi:Na+/H+ antiporter subunit E [Devriesea agamarum]|uniref:Na+/H+ antiporter subunit E n=1 Tax=Devriesea agamarum TaxID=472569 RepID=UPI000ACF475E|nr:Na+/H+ antiporter subunit E [Devriesea agamarum]